MFTLPRRRYCLGILLIVTSSVLSKGVYSDEHQQNEKNAWKQLSQGTAIAIMRHALAPGGGDPANFRVDDCSTQRNLSEQGRDQARAIGALFRDNGIEAASVYTSQWCRCRDTARLLDIGTPEDFPALNSFFQNRSVADEQTMQLRTAVDRWLANSSGPVVLVTHQVNISALTNNFTSSGEILIITVKEGNVRVLASIPTLN